MYTCSYYCQVLWIIDITPFTYLAYLPLLPLRALPANSSSLFIPAAIIVWLPPRSALPYLLPGTQRYCQRQSGEPYYVVVTVPYNFLPTAPSCVCPNSPSYPT